MRQARCGARGAKAVAVAACLASTAALVLTGCSFDESALVFGGDERSRNDSRGGSSGAGDDGPGAGSPDAGPRPDRRDGSIDADLADADTSTPQAGASGPDSGGGSGGGGGSGSGANAGTDAGDRDAAAPGCPQGPTCVCGHTRRQTPTDPCAAPECPVDECAPDEDCTLARFASSTYYVCSNARSQDDAAARCAAINGMHLIFVGSEEEDEFMYDSVEGKVWIGAVENDEGVWVWLDGSEFYDDEPIEDAYVNWDDSVDEPNGLGVGTGDVTCAIAWSDTEAWADTNCSSVNGYVCELEL